ncbi:gliding motility lipoprotein GldK [Apibacter muscae]|uniref:Gliding motility lipoprotein GldK n=1 Tax=Apibacter muscae TaxID=2509004 RepID=A0A563DB66_9FLAO|nr:gliding motility lipoprotein GldK [Apibacter muscae]TWP23554.1 gliding motility lipoprotein GldK [Apibacter muscae]TWP27465.1 gliding motility lipoprotein GldK [Apibacter muscae]TWP28879.1 gliding motility lipoprotein GldK [Apibacter muscae]
MRKVLLLLLATATLASCKSSKKGKAGKPGVQGEIVATQQSQKWNNKKPYGMVPIPGGAFVLGQADMDFSGSVGKAPLTTVTVSAFYMDDTEVTNAEYREFIKYVKDSIARTRLAERADQEGEEGIGRYAFLNKKSESEQNAYQQMLEERGGREGYDESKKLDWSVPLEWRTANYPDVAYAEVMESMYYPPEERFNNERVIDPRKLIYQFTWIDQLEAVKKKGRGESFLKREEIAIYPDTTVWLRDFNYSFNEPLFEQYFWHKAYSKYPVVGVTWDQARAFCAYSTKSKNDYNQSRKKKIEKVFPYRLPSEVEWEYAARGGLENASYPWGGPYLIDDRGCYLANFKPKRGDYMEGEKGFLYTAPVKSFQKNGFGLYDMAGNVSEWTVSAFNNSSYIISSTLNPYLGNRIEDPRKVIKGGSWKDIGYMLMVSERDWEHKDSARSYIGFRRVQTIPEGSNVKFPKIKKLQ